MDSRHIIQRRIFFSQSELCPDPCRSGAGEFQQIKSHAGVGTGGEVHCDPGDWCVVSAGSAEKIPVFHGPSGGIADTDDQILGTKQCFGFRERQLNGPLLAGGAIECSDRFLPADRTVVIKQTGGNFVFFRRTGKIGDRDPGGVG